MSDEHREVKLVLTERHLTREGLRKFNGTYTFVAAFNERGELVKHWRDEAMSFDIYDVKQVNPPYAPEVGDIVQVVSVNDHYHKRIGTVVPTSMLNTVRVDFGTGTCAFFYEDLVKIGERADKKGDRG